MRYLVALGSLTMLSVAPAAIAIVVVRNLPSLPHNVPLSVDSPSHSEAMRLDRVRPTMAVPDTPVAAATADLPRTLR